MITQLPIFRCVQHFKNNTRKRNYVKGLNYVKKINSRPDFELNLNNLCKSAAGKSNAPLRLKSYLTFEAIKLLFESFAYSNFNYCLLGWNFAGVKAINKIENMQKRALRFLLDYYERSYDTLLMKVKKPAITSE